MENVETDFVLSPITTTLFHTGLENYTPISNHISTYKFNLKFLTIVESYLYFRCHMLVDANNLRDSLNRADFSLILDLWFSDTTVNALTLVSSRTLQLNFSPIEGLHYHLPVVFDYFHLSAVSITIHAALTALVQPSMKYVSFSLNIKIASITIFFF